MAHQESDREDLLRDATALVERVEVASATAPPADRVVVGFRADGAMSIFFGGDPVYQFNTVGELRRAFCHGLLFKAVRGRIVALQRVRQQHEVQLVRRELPGDEQLLFLSGLRRRMSEFIQQLEAGQFSVVGQVPADADVLGRVRKWFAEHDLTVIARTPHVRAATREHCG